MEKLFITKDNLRLLVKVLKKSCDEFIAPKREHLDDIVFGDTKDGGGELLEYDGNSVISPRAFLLPQTEPLFEINSAKDCSFSTIEDKKKRIFYGVRPCDIKALTLMQSFFLDEFVDEFYQRKIKNSTFIALACAKRCSDKSFCYEMDSGPQGKEGFDLQLIPLSLPSPCGQGLGKGYLVELGSRKGGEIARKNKKLFAGATPLYEKESKKALRDFTKGVKRIDYKKLAGIMEEDKVKETIWDDLGLRCVICSGCISLCPTCSCFSIVDRMNPALSMDRLGGRIKGGVNGAKGVRMRYCDGCPYAGFTRMAGGNLPEPLHKEHIRRFFEHKLNVDVERYGMPSCVGCARCIQTCPGNINIKQFIEKVIEAAE